MPNDNNYGYSEHTLSKQCDLAYILSMLFPIYTGITSRCDYLEPQVYYFDINAGPATSLDSFILGSPIIFLEKAFELSVNYRAVFIENQRTHYERLQRALAFYPNVKIHYGDHRDIMKDYLNKRGQKRTGLIYADPNGEPITEFEVLEQTSKTKRYEQLDILIHFSATAIKRAKRANRCMIDYLARINKKVWFVREPQDKWQWTFLFGTNWKDCPIPGKEFVPLASERGLAIIERLNEVQSANSRLQPLLL